MCHRVSMAHGPNPREPGSDLIAPSHSAPLRPKLRRQTHYCHRCSTRRQLSEDEILERLRRRALPLVREADADVGEETLDGCRRCRT